MCIRVVGLMCVFCGDLIYCKMVAFALCRLAQVVYRLCNVLCELFECNSSIYILRAFIEMFLRLM